jgi:hypothetical protein
VLYDLNVLLDVVLAREPFLAASARALDAVPRGEVVGLMAGHAVTTLYYIARRHLGDPVARQQMTHLLAGLQVAAVTDSVIRSALAIGSGDFEDAVTYAAALEARADVIVTRDPRGFPGSALAVALPETFCPTA